MIDNPTQTGENTKMDKTDLQLVAEGNRDPELVRRVRENAERVRAEIRQKEGILNIGVDIIREARESR